jgi:hypothetical protein
MEKFMKKRVVVWGTGNVGRPAIRAVAAHRDLELAGVIVSNPAKVGQDAGELAGIGAQGVKATDDWINLLKQKVDAVVYTANADMRAEAAFGELLTCLSMGVNVVSTAFYPLLYPPAGVKQVNELVRGACVKGNSSVFVSGIDPGWAMDILPTLLSGVVSDIQEIRSREIFNYALYDQPQVVRDVIGFGKPMDTSLRTVWAPMVQIVADALQYPLDGIETFVERRALEKTIVVPGMGVFEQGTQGAFRFEVRGLKNGVARIVVEHITRIDDDCASDWAYPPEGRGCHQVVISGNPDLTVTLHGHDGVEPGPAGGGNATAANRIVNAIPAVCAAHAGIISPLDLPTIHGGAQLRC